jgi:hypothetical protein
MTDQQTINTASDPSPQAFGELVSTVELPTADPSPQEALNPEAQPEVKTEVKTEGETVESKEEEPKPKGDEFRFDKHPRFQELNRSVKEFREQNKQLLAEIESLKQQTPKEAPYKDWSKMSDDEVLDWQSSDPKGFLDNLNKAFDYAVEQKMSAYQEQVQRMTEKQSYESSLAKTFEEYAHQNPDFDELWDSGEIQDYMKKHPGHNAISAHMAMTSDAKLEKIKQEAADKALKEYEAAQRSKRATKVMGSAPASVPTSPNHADDRLKNPNKYGGDTNVLVARLMERRRQQGM